MKTDAAHSRRAWWEQLVAGLVIPCIFALQVGGCGAAGGAAATDETFSTGAGGIHDGETIFKGTFFGMGPVAQLVPEIWTNRDVNLIKAQLSNPDTANRARAVDGYSGFVDRLVG